MPIDAALDTLITNAPNLIIAIWVIWKGAHLVEKLLETQKWMLEEFMKLHPPQEEGTKSTPEKAPAGTAEYRS